MANSRFKEDRIVRMAELPKIVGLSRTSLYGAIAKGLFPKPVRLTERNAVGWRLSELCEWIQSRQHAA